MDETIKMKYKYTTEGGNHLVGHLSFAIKASDSKVRKVKEAIERALSEQPKS